jgi:hypothetical protein
VAPFGSRRIEPLAGPVPLSAEQYPVSGPGEPLTPLCGGMAPVPDGSTAVLG